tara:strand:+ start:136 stop:528 length:393 start_codon:yes stop_codon:yes gene_type:complete
MRYRKTRRFRHNRSNGRGHHGHGRDSNGEQSRLRPVSFSRDRIRNNIKLPQGAEKLAEKYNALAKEALSSGDKIMAENYFQYADHYTRILDERRLNQNQNKIQVVEEKKEVNNNSNLSNELNQNKTEEKK